MVVGQRSFRTTHLSIVKSKRKWANLLGLLYIEDWKISCPETSVTNYKFSLRNIREEWRSHIRFQQNFKHYKAREFISGTVSINVKCSVNCSGLKREVFIQETATLSQPAHRTATYRCDDTRYCIIQFGPPDYEHIVLETCRGV